MGKKFRIFLFVCSAWLFAPMIGNASTKIECAGRLYSAKATAYGPNTFIADIDLGFGMTYRGQIRLYQTIVPDDRPSRNTEAAMALTGKISGKALTLCVVDRDGYYAIVYVDGENINAWMISKRFLKHFAIIGNRTF